MAESLEQYARRIREEKEDKKRMKFTGLKSGAKKVSRFLGYGLTPMEKEARHIAKVQKFEKEAEYLEKRRRVEIARADIRVARMSGKPRRAQLSPTGSIYDPPSLFDFPSQFSEPRSKRKKGMKASKKEKQRRREVIDLFGNVGGV